MSTWMMSTDKAKVAYLSFAFRSSEGVQSTALEGVSNTAIPGTSPLMSSCDDILMTLNSTYMPFAIYVG